MKLLWAILNVHDASIVSHSVEDLFGDMSDDDEEELGLKIDVTEELPDISKSPAIRAAAPYSGSEALLFNLYLYWYFTNCGVPGPPCVRVFACI